MRRATALVATVALATGAHGCVQHPVVTTTVAGAVIGFGACEIDAERVGDCAIIGAAAAAALGLITWAVFHFTDQDQHRLLVPDNELGSDGSVSIHSYTPRPPVPLGSDAGSAAPMTAPPIAPAPAVDAGIPDAPAAPAPDAP